MKYSGDLYGKIGNKYPKLTQTTEDIDLVESLAKEALEVAREAIMTLHSIYGHAQHCNECHSFEMAKECLDNMGGFGRINDIEDRLKA